MGVLCRAQVGAETSTNPWSVGNEDNTYINISDKNDIAKFAKHFMPPKMKYSAVLWDNQFMWGQT